jgi:hypothetical protein
MDAEDSRCVQNARSEFARLMMIALQPGLVYRPCSSCTSIRSWPHHDCHSSRSSPSHFVQHWLLPWDVARGKQLTKRFTPTKLACVSRHDVHWTLNMNQNGLSCVSSGRRLVTLRYNSATLNLNSSPWKCKASCTLQARGCLLHTLSTPL